MNEVTLLLLVMAAAQVASALALCQIVGRLSDRDVRASGGPHVEPPLPWLLPSSWGGYLSRVAAALEGQDAEMARVSDALRVLADGLAGPVRAERERGAGRRCCEGGDTLDDYDDRRRGAGEEG